ncbi:MAG: hypothetical protein JWM88_126 [Verrucomicrobia bacterium]|nr:hypothetical protein [Verrucomicrobiota bacterium]
MLFLGNSRISVALLDPADAEDRKRQGTRYCWGGYIWQVTHREAGPVFTGPEWPEAKPKPFNGQGLPESFRHAQFGSGRPLMLEQGHGFIIGIGDVAPGPDGDVVVVRPCEWSITHAPSAIEFCTAQSRNGYTCQVTRRVMIDGATVSSTTSIANVGTRPLPLHWFAHPFFALTDRLLTCELPATWGMNENVGYTLDPAHRLSFRRRFENIDDGHFERLKVGASTPLRAILSHPKLSRIIFSTDFVPDWCPVWGNNNTWSIEPYLETELAPGTHRAWTLRYELEQAGAATPSGLTPP